MFKVPPLWTKTPPPAPRPPPPIASEGVITPCPILEDAVRCRRRRPAAPAAGRIQPSAHHRAKATIAADEVLVLARRARRAAAAAKTALAANAAATTATAA